MVALGKQGRYGNAAVGQGAESCGREGGGGIDLWSNEIAKGSA